MLIRTRMTFSRRLGKLKVGADPLGPRVFLRLRCTLHFPLLALAALTKRC